MSTFAEDSEALLNVYLQSSEKILQKDKFLIPMGMLLDKNGEISFQALAPEDESAAADTAEHLVAYRKLLDKVRKGNRATLLGYDVKLNDPDYKDAIAIEIRGPKKEDDILIGLPYKFSKITKKLVTGEIFRQR